MAQVLCAESWGWGKGVIVGNTQGLQKKSDIYETGVLGNRINSEKEMRPKETMAESVQNKNTYIEEVLRNNSWIQKASGHIKLKQLKPETKKKH